ncbi:MAG: DEAD/DEAH box helicase [Clostridia bacterium]|nr:DEAD/DEAH box helicase [Clostridia bacterium]
MIDEVFNIEVNSNKQILSSQTTIYKTERFFYQTKKLANIDRFVLKISESMQTLVFELFKKYETSKEVNCFKVETFDKSFSFLVKVGFQLHSKAVDDDDIVFLEMLEGNENAKMNDQRVNTYLAGHKIFNVTIRPIGYDTLESDLKKLYFLSNTEYVNFPMLNDKQKALVEIQNENVLVQGVAGSGKTNVCLSKIIWVACRNYTGKILYTTFSRGLLIDTKNKVEVFKNNIKNFIADYKNNRIIFLDKDHKRAVENRLGIHLVADNDFNLIKKLEQVVSFLETHVDYFLIEDLFKNEYNTEFEIADEKVFLNNFLKNINNHQLRSRLEKIKNISPSIIYKEIYGMIFGCYNADTKAEMLSLEEYKKKRENSFSSAECEVIYGIAKLYDEYQKTQNLLDNNKISHKLLKNALKMQKYSLSIIDEVQDFTEVNLNLFKAISIKMFAVGDALQMINPSYFSFAYLKRLMYTEDVTNVEELECNYRNNKKIVEILDDLSELNIREFGTHSFVLSGESIDEDTATNAIFVEDENFLKKLQSQKFENFTIIVSDFKKKEELRKLFKKQEILTISEIKGLERDTVLLLDVLSDSEDKWKKLSEFKINHKQADENSVYRYYFNLFYVGVSRAKHNIFVYEKSKIDMFEDFFKTNFEGLSGTDAYVKFSDIVSKIEIDDDEIFERINEFIKLGQWDNARFYAEKFEDDTLRVQQLAKIDAFENLVFKGKNREAGIKLWRAGLTADAKKQFAISGDTKLIEFLDQLEGRASANLDADIVRFFVDFDDNDEAQKLILEVVNQDLENMRLRHRQTKQKLKEFKEKYNGK